MRIYGECDSDGRVMNFRLCLIEAVLEFQLSLNDFIYYPFDFCILVSYNSLPQFVLQRFGDFHIPSTFGFIFVCFIFSFSCLLFWGVLLAYNSIWIHWEG